MRRSILIVLAHLYLDAAAVALELSGVAADLGLSFRTGVSENLADAANALDSISTAGGFGETLFALYVTVASAIEGFLAGVFAGPTMFVNLGVPSWAVAFVYVAAGALVGLDIIYTLTGRDL